MSTLLDDYHAWSPGTKIELVHGRRIELLRLVNGKYQRQTPDVTAGYFVSSVPGLTFFPDKIWLAKDDWDYPLEESWFEVASDAPRLTRLPKMGDGVDWSKALLKFPVALDPVAIAFEDYIYWCPEAKFEFAHGRPDISGREGIKGLALSVRPSSRRGPDGGTPAWGLRRERSAFD